MNNKESINLKNYWNDEKKDKRIEKNPPKQDIKKEHNNQMNMNLDDENKSTIALVIIAVIAIAGTALLYFYIQEQKQNDIDDYNRSVREYNKSLIEQQKRDSNNSYINKNYAESKYFKIKYETIGNNYDSNFIYNMNVIINNLNIVVSFFKYQPFCHIIYYLKLLILENLNIFILL